jgi:hypothetical protein
MVKFVKHDDDGRLVSPGSYGLLDYSTPGMRLEVQAEPKSAGQCAAGIHALHLPDHGQPMAPRDVLFGDLTAVLLHDCQVVWDDEPHGKCRLSAATVGEVLDPQSPTFRALLTGNGSGAWMQVALHAAAGAGQVAFADMIRTHMEDNQ